MYSGRKLCGSCVVVVRRFTTSMLCRLMSMRTSTPSHSSLAGLATSHVSTCMRAQPYATCMQPALQSTQGQPARLCRTGAALLHAASTSLGKSVFIQFLPPAEGDARGAAIVGQPCKSTVEHESTRFRDSELL